MAEDRRGAPVAVVRMELTDVAGAVALHQRGLGNELVARLGSRTLGHYHRAYLSSPSGLALVARSEVPGEVLGFLLGAIDPPTHYRYVMSSAGSRLALSTAVHAASHPALAWELLRTRALRWARGVLRIAGGRGIAGGRAGGGADPAAADRPATDPADTDPADTDPADTDRADTDRAEADRAETDRAEADRAETDRAETDRGSASGTPGGAPASVEAVTPVPTAEVTHVVVDERQRGRGVGRALLEAALRQAAAGGAARAELVTPIDDAGAAAFYEACGWQRDGAVSSRSGERFVRFVIDLAPPAGRGAEAPVGGQP